MTAAPAIDFVQPAHFWMPPRVGSYGDEAVDLIRLAGRELDPEQALAVDAMLSYGPGGKWVALESAIIESRQNGKTGGVVLPVVLFDLFMLPPDRIVWTAHLFRTSRDAFADVDACIAATPELSKRVKKITYANGEEAVDLHTGARLEFLARSKGGGRGLGGKRVVMDEALYLAAEAMGALLPTLSARPDPQVNYASSAGVSTSDHLRSLHDRGCAGDDPSLIYLEWCAPRGGCADGNDCDHSIDRDGCALDDEDKWKLANHALDRRISREYVRQERRALARIPLEFARERLGWWDAPAITLALIPADRWDPLRVDAPADDPAAIGLDMTWDREWATLGWAVGDYVDIHEHRRGAGWVVAEAKKLQAQYPVPVWVHPKGPAGPLIDPLRDAGVLVEEISSEDYPRACGGIYDAIMQGALGHGGHPALDAAVTGAATRGGEAWVWDRKHGSVISPLVAITLARWGAIQSNVYENRGLVVL